MAPLFAGFMRDLHIMYLQDAINAARAATLVACLPEVITGDTHSHMNTLAIYCMLTM